jgi:hypothetical protein
VSVPPQPPEFPLPPAFSVLSVPSVLRTAVNDSAVPPSLRPRPPLPQSERGSCPTSRPAIPHFCSRPGFSHSLAVSPFPAAVTNGLQFIENTSTLSPLFATLAQSSRTNPFICNSYRKSPGVGYNSFSRTSPLRHPPISLVSCSAKLSRAHDSRITTHSHHPRPFMRSSPAAAPKTVFFCIFLHVAKSYLPPFHQLPRSFGKTPGGGWGCLGAFRPGPRSANEATLPVRFFTSLDHYFLSFPRVVTAASFRHHCSLFTVHCSLSSRTVAPHPAKCQNPSVVFFATRGSPGSGTLGNNSAWLGV